jgi:hypothetical protein
MRCGFAKIRKKNWMERVFLDGDFIAFGVGIMEHGLDGWDTDFLGWGFLGTRIEWMGHGFSRLRRFWIS